MGSPITSDTPIFSQRFGFLPGLGAALLLMSLHPLEAQSVSQVTLGQASMDDLFIGFQSPNGSFQTSKDLLLDFGPASFFTSDTNQILNLGNFRSYLQSTFGNSWYNNTGVLWGAAASTPNGTAGNGITDPGNTLYLTTPTTTVGVPGSTLTSKLSASQAKAAQNINGLVTEYNSIQSLPPQISSSDPTSWSGVFYGGQSPVSANYPNATLEAAFTGSTAAGSVLNLQRLAPASSARGTPALNLGYLSIDDSGNISYTPYALTIGGGGGGGSYAGPWIWTGGSGNWSVTNNWQSNANASNGYAVGISGTLGGTITNDLVTNLSSLTFSNGAGAYTLTGTNAGQTLAISGGLTNNSASTQTIALSLAGVGNVNQSGVGTLILASSNSYSGGTVLNGGTVIAVNNASFGGGNLSVQTASTVAAGASSLLTTNAIAIAGGANLTMDTVANNWQHAGLLSGAGSLAKSGIGTLTLSGSSTNFQALTAVNAGTLQVSGNLGSGTVTVISGASLSGNGSIGGLQLNNGATLTGGVNGAIGQLSITGGMVPAAGSVMNWKMADAGGSAGTGYDSFSVGGSLNLTGLGTSSSMQFNLLSTVGGVTNFLNTQNSQWLVASAGSILGFSTNDFSINTAGFANLLGGGSFSFSTNTLGNGFGLYLNFIALGVNPWTGNIAAGTSTISGQTVTSTNSAVIGANASRNGSVSIVNNGVWNIPGSLTVGGSTTGNGTLTIGSGGTLQANGLKISDQAGSKGLVLIANGASPSALSLGSGTITFGQGKGQLQLAQTGAEIISNAVSGKGMIVSSGTGTTTFSANNSGFSGTNYMTSGTEVLASAAQLGGSVNLAGKTSVLALNTGASLSGTSPVAVAGLLLDNSGLSFTNAIKGKVVLAPTGSLQKTYTLGSSVAGFGAGIGAGRSFSILAGSAASNTLSASLINGALNFKGTYTNAAVLSLTDPSFSSIKNTIQWYNADTSKWVNTVQGNGQGGAATNVGTTSILSLLGSTNAKLWGSYGFRGSFNTFLIDIASLNLPNGLSSLNVLGNSMINSDLNMIMGAYGYDASTHSAWAVIDHNSIFNSGKGAVTSQLRNAALLDAGVTSDLSVFNVSPQSVQIVPEPGTWGLLVSGAFFLALVFIRRGGKVL